MGPQIAIIGLGAAGLLLSATREKIPHKPGGRGPELKRRDDRNETDLDIGGKNGQRENGQQAAERVA